MRYTYTIAHAYTALYIYAALFIYSICSSPYLQHSSQCPDAVGECLVSAIQAHVQGGSLHTDDGNSVVQQPHILRDQQVKALLDDSQILPAGDVGCDVLNVTLDIGGQVLQVGSETSMNRMRAATDADIMVQLQMATATDGYSYSYIWLHADRLCYTYHN